MTEGEIENERDGGRKGNGVKMRDPGNKKRRDRRLEARTDQRGGERSRRDGRGEKERRGAKLEGAAEGAEKERRDGQRGRKNVE